jgi:hypothetical protein
MITRTNAFQTSDDKTHATLEDAQKHELELISGHGGDSVAWLMQNKEKILDILTTTTTSKPRARKVNGGKKQRKFVADPAPPATAP